MAVTYTKDGKIPLTSRFSSDVFEALRKYAFEQNLTPNKAVIQLVESALMKPKTK